MARRRMRLGVEDRQTPPQPTTASMEALVRREIVDIPARCPRGEDYTLREVVMRLAKEIDNLRRVIIEMQRTYPPR